jgi:catechol 2,3-dioxygenase-like lactoylglutathione lyase family enzyme
MKLAQAIVFCADVPRMQAFYQERLGLTVLAAEPGWVRLDAGGVVLGLHAISHAAKPADPPAERSEACTKLWRPDVLRRHRPGGQRVPADHALIARRAPLLLQRGHPDPGERSRRERHRQVGPRWIGREVLGVVCERRLAAGDRVARRHAVRPAGRAPDAYTGLPEMAAGTQIVEDERPARVHASLSDRASDAT